MFFPSIKGNPKYYSVDKAYEVAAEYQQDELDWTFNVVKSGNGLAYIEVRDEGNEIIETHI